MSSNAFDLGASIGSAVLGSGANIISTAMTNRANERMQQQQNAWNLEQWERNNAYNSPAAQMQRLKAAGINPDLMYGQNASGASGNSSAPAQGTQPIPKQPFFLDPLMLAQLKNIDADTELKKSDANQKDAQTEGINYDNITKEASAAYQEEWLETWNGYDKNKKRQMFDNMLSTCYIQEENALESAKNGKFQNEEDYWNHMLQLYIIKGSIYGFDGLKIEYGGLSATPEWISRMQQGKMNDLISKQIEGALTEGNIDFVRKHFQLMDASLVGQQRENAKKLLEEDILKIEKRIKELERDYQEWYNDDSKILEFFGIKFSPREWQIIAPMAKEFVSMLAYADQGGPIILEEGPQGKGKKGKKGKTTKGTKGFKLPKIKALKGGTIHM